MICNCQILFLVRRFFHLKIKVNLQKRRPRVEEINETCCGPKSFEINKTWKNGIHKIKRFFFFIARRHQLSVKQNMGHNTDADFSYEKQVKRMSLKTPKTEKSLKLIGLEIKGFSYWRNCSIVSVGKRSIEIFSIKQGSNYNRFLILFAVEILHMTTCFIPRFQFSCPQLRMWTEKTNHRLWYCRRKRASER